MTQAAPRLEIAIIGAGLAGSALATLLARDAKPPLTALFDPCPPGPGNAYASGVAGHLMNGPVRAMSAIPGDDTHLARWLGAAPDDTLIPRVRYGEYLRETVAGALQNGGAVRFVGRAVLDVVPHEGGYLIEDAAGARWHAETVVLALGNPPPRTTLVPRSVSEDAHYVGDPWRFDARRVRGDVLLIGSGLTAMDAVVALDDRGFAGRVTIVSRHGLLPLDEDPSVRAADPDALGLDPTTPAGLLRTMRAAARRLAAQDEDWRRVVEAIRKRTPAIWAGWDLHERQRFLRHLQPYWAIHRYRVPVEIAQRYRAMEARGALTLRRGTVADAQADHDGFRVVVAAGDTPEELRVGTIVNCTGPESDYLRIERRLEENLVRRGLIRPDALRLGIDATPQFRVIGSHGAPWPSLFTLGPPLRGLWYETTGVPEVRDHAGRLARVLLVRRG